MPMITPEGIPFRSEILGRLRPEILPMSAPHTNGVAQIAIKGERHGDIDLVVAIQPELITLERDQGLPLQVEINTEGPIEGSALKRVIRLPVFEEPITQLVLVRGTEPEEWIAGGEGVRIVSADRISNLALVLGGYAFYKQNGKKITRPVFD